MSVVAYLIVAYCVAHHFARKANTLDWQQFIPLALAWPFYPIAWILGKVVK